MVQRGSSIATRIRFLGMIFFNLETHCVKQEHIKITPKSLFIWSQFFFLTCSGPFRSFILPSIKMSDLEDVGVHWDGGGLVQRHQQDAISNLWADPR